MANKAIHVVKFGKIRGLIHANINGSGKVWHSVNIVRLYQDDRGAWKNSTSLGRDDLLVAAEVARECYLHIASLGGEAVESVEST